MAARLRATVPALVVAAVLAGAAQASPTAAARAKGPAVDGPVVFPVVRGARYTDDFGQPRGSRRHEGNDLMAPCGTAALAAADGVVRLHTSRMGGLMLYLDAGRHEYVYIHLDNDRTAGNDNRGGPDTAYAAGIGDGSRVRAGQVIAYVGNSGDANGTACHLHFEDHRDGRAVDPYGGLRRAAVAAFGVPYGRPPAPVAPTLTGVVSAVRADGVSLAATRLSLDGRRWAPLRRTVVLAVDPAVLAAPGPSVVGTTVRAALTAAVPTLPRLVLAPDAWSLAALTPVTATTSR